MAIVERSTTIITLTEIQINPDLIIGYSIELRSPDIIWLVLGIGDNFRCAILTVYVDPVAA